MAISNLVVCGHQLLTRRRSTKIVEIVVSGTMMAVRTKV